MKTKNKVVQFCMIFSISGMLTSSDMESVLEVGRDNQLLSAKSQETIDATERQTDKIVNEWKAVSKQVEGLKLYNEQKRIQIQAQLDLMDKLDEQLVQVVVMQRQIPPLAQRMLESLESFISLDTPFRKGRTAISMSHYSQFSTQWHPYLRGSCRNKTIDLIHFSILQYQ